MKKTKNVLGRYTGSEMPTQCHYCKYNPKNCKNLYKVFSYRNGIQLCPDRLDMFELSLDELNVDRKEFAVIAKHNSVDGAKKWEMPYSQPVTIYIDHETYGGIMFAVKYHEEYTRNEPEEEFKDEITDLICNVVSNAISETSLTDTLFNH